MAPLLSVYFLGPLAVEAGAASVVLRYNKARGLLAYLVLEQGFHTRDSLAYLLWPDESIQAGREKLKRMLFELKEALGSDFVEGNRDVLRMRTEAGIWTDVAEFTETSELAHRELKVNAQVDLELMAHAARLYRGQFLQGLDIEDAPDFSSWVELRRERYQQSFLRVIRFLAEGHERNGELRLAIDRAQQLTVAAPLDDEHWRYFLQLLVTGGQNERAHQEFEHYRHMLEVELGASPDPTVARILERCVNVDGDVPSGAPLMAERRQLTVVSCEFEACGEPEDVADMVGRQVARCEAVFHQASAHTVRTPSGGLLAYFGYPLAMEESARRAVLAALACRPDDDSRSVPHPSDAGVDVYIGVDTGVVISAAHAGVPDAGGTVSRRAMHVGNLGGGGRVIVSGTTRRMLRSVFDFTFAGRLHDRRGGTDFDAFRVQDGPSVSAVAALSYQNRFHGRKAELERLRQIWQDDTVHACLVSGDAGLGKSFLLEHFMANEQVAGVVFKCAADLQQMPLRPLAGWVAQLRLDSDLAQNSPEEHAEFIHRLRRMESLLNLSKTDTSVAVAALIGKEETLVPELRRLIELTVPLGGVLCFDDVHWADPSTREVIASLVEKPLPQRSVYIAARPEFLYPWRRSARVEVMVLQPLDEEAVVELVHAVAGGRGLTSDMLHRIVQLAEGVPLYAKELTADQLANAAGSMPLLADELARLSLPRSLNDLLMSRIDSVGSVKPIAQFAAAAGGEFTIDLLQAAMDRPRAELTEAIAVLLRHKLIVRLDDKRYMFRHALLREAAYQSQARPARLDAHRRLAQVLKQDLLSDHNTPESLAWHYHSAGDRRLAFKYSLLAARKSVARSAYREAVGYYRSALGLLERADVHASSTMDELDIRMELGVQQCVLYGFGSAEVVDTFREALALAQPLGDDPRSFPIYWGLWRSAGSWADHSTAAELGNTLLRLARSSNDPDLLVRACLARGKTFLVQGQLPQALAELEKGVASHDPARAGFALGEDALTLCLGILGVVYWYEGRSDDALKASAASIARARDLNHGYSLASALILGCCMYRLRGDIGMVISLSADAALVARDIGTPVWAEMAHSFQCWSRAAQGDQDVLASIGASVEKMASLTSALVPAVLLQWASACELAGDSRTGLQVVDRALAAVGETRGEHNLSELQRLKGMFLFEQQALGATYRPWLDRALATAQAMASPPLVLRAVLLLIRHSAHPTPEYLNLLSKNLNLVQGGGDQWEVREALDVLSNGAGSLRGARV